MTTSSRCNLTPADMRQQAAILRARDYPGCADAFEDLADLRESREGDSGLIDWLQAQIVDTIYLDDGRIIDVRGEDVRAAIQKAMSPPDPPTDHIVDVNKMVPAPPTGESMGEEWEWGVRASNQAGGAPSLVFPTKASAEYWVLNGRDKLFRRRPAGVWQAVESEEGSNGK